MSSVPRKLHTRLPQRFNRPVTPATRSFVERRHKRIRQYRTERRRRFLRRVGGWLAEGLSSCRRWLPLLGAALAALAVALVLFSPLLRIREIRIVRTEGRINVQEVLSALGPIYGSHLVFLSRHDVETRVREAVPDLASVHVEKSYPSQLSVRIVLHPLIARLRIEHQQKQATPSATGALLSASGSQLQQFDYLTDTGVYVASSAALHEVSLPVIRVVDWGVRPLPGTVLLSFEFLDRLQRAEQVLTREFGLQVRTRTVFLRAREFHIDTPTFSLWFDLRTPLQAQLGRLRTFLKSVKMQQIREYVDLRLAGRVVYR